MMYFMRGKVAFTLKIVVLSLIGAILLMLTQSAFAQREYVIAGFLALTTGIQLQHIGLQS